MVLLFSNSYSVLIYSVFAIRFSTEEKIEIDCRSFLSFTKNVQARRALQYDTNSPVEYNVSYEGERAECEMNPLLSVTSVIK